MCSEEKFMCFPLPMQGSRYMYTKNIPATSFVQAKINDIDFLARFVIRGSAEWMWFKQGKIAEKL